MSTTTPNAKVQALADAMVSCGTDSVADFLNGYATEDERADALSLTAESMQAAMDLAAAKLDAVTDAL
jgi:hypothetical protein